MVKVRESEKKVSKVKEREFHKGARLSGTKVPAKDTPKPVKPKKTDGKPEKKVKAKPSVAPKKSTRNDEHGIDRENDLPWCEKKVRLFKCLRKLGAFGKDTAKDNKAIVNMSNERLTAKDVRHYSYHARAAGLIDLVEGQRGYLFYLTKKGKNVNPDEEFKRQEAKKDKKSA